MISPLLTPLGLPTYVKEQNAIDTFFSDYSRVLLLRKDGSHAIGHISKENVIIDKKSVEIVSTIKSNCMIYVNSTKILSETMMQNERLPVKIIGQLADNRILIKEESILYFNR